MGNGLKTGIVKQKKIIVSNPDIKVIEKNTWKKYFKVYDNLNKTPSYSKLLSDIIRYSNIQDKETILDLGCGTGNLVTYLNAAGISYMGLDISDDALNLARTKKNKNIVKKSFLRHDIKKPLPVRSNSVDKVIINNVLCFLDNAEIGILLKEIKRILKESGTLVVSTPLENSNPKLIFQESFDILKRDMGYVRAWTYLAKNSIPVFKIFRYSSFIRKQATNNFYNFLDRNAIKYMLSSSGFSNVHCISAYAGGNILAVCVNHRAKPENTIDPLS